MNCPFCGTENTDDSLYCKKCGRKMSGTVTCPACGASAPADGEYCTRCGAKLNTHAPAQAEREKPHPAAWRQVLVTVGNALAVFAALASVIFLFCLGCENGIADTGDMWLDLSGRNIYYYFGEVYRDLYNIFTTSTPVLVGTAGYTFAIAGTLLSAGMIVSVSVLFILTLVRFVRSFSGKGGSVTAMAAKTYFVYLAFALLFLALHAAKLVYSGEFSFPGYRTVLNGATVAGIVIGAVGILAAAVLNAIAREEKIGKERILQLGFSGVCLLLVTAVFALLSGAVVGIGATDGEYSIVSKFGLLIAYQVISVNGNVTTYAPATSDAEYAVYEANQTTVAACSVLGFVFLVVLFLLLAVLASSLVKNIAAPDEKPKTLRYMIPAILFTVGLTICSALAASALAALSVGDGASGLTASAQFTLPLVASVLSALVLILLIVYGALTGGKDENKE